jgi:hypothetical protein
MKNNVLKSIGVLLLAFVVNGLLSAVTDFILESIGVLPDPSKGLFETWALLLVLFYRGAYAIFTGYLIARLAPSKPMLHALILGVIGTMIVLLAMTNPTVAEKAPMWYGYTLAAITIPCMMFGVVINKSWSADTQAR